MKWIIGMISRTAAPALAWVAVGVAAFIGALMAGLGVQTWRLGNVQERLGAAEATLGVCRDANRQAKEHIDEINEQARRNVERARTARREAEAAARRAETERSELDQALATTRRDLQEAMAGDECGARLVPPAVDRVFRRAPGSDGDGDENG